MTLDLFKVEQGVNEGMQGILYQIITVMNIITIVAHIHHHHYRHHHQIIFSLSRCR